MYGRTKSKKNDRDNIRRSYTVAGWAKRHPLPEWFFEIEDARELGVKPWELHLVPIHWRLKAREVSIAKKQAKQEIGRSAKAMGVYVIEL